MIAEFDRHEIDYFLAGSYSSNFYGIVRATKDADFVAVLTGKCDRWIDGLPSEFKVDPQPSFETVTGTLRETIRVPSIAFEIEVFHLSDDPHDQARFARRRKVFDEIIGTEVSLPTAEDVIITKLRWALLAKRSKDTEDVRDVIAVQGDEAFDWDYIHHWCGLHGTRALLDEIRASIPPID
jgi:hypothetical protein